MTDQVNSKTDQVSEQVSDQVDFEPVCCCKKLLRAQEENEELKNKIENLEIKHQRYRECSMQLNNKYKSALEEIKKIVEIACETYRYNGSSEYKKILTKISEAIGKE